MASDMFRPSGLTSDDVKSPFQGKRFGFEPEITAKDARKSCRIYEVGISSYGRTYHAGKKIGWRDGVRSIWYIVKFNLLVK